MLIRTHEQAEQPTRTRLVQKCFQMRVFLAAVCVVLASCAADGSYVLTGAKRSPIDPKTVRLYTEPPPGAEQVAILESRSGTALAVTDQGMMDAAIEHLKKQAASLGANGVVLRSTGKTSSGGAIVPVGRTAYYVDDEEKTAAGIAIYVPPEEQEKR